MSEIIKITLEIEDKPTGIPYRRSSEDDQSHSYLRLKGNRELIDQLPECVREQTLMDCVWYLNRPESVLETIGCECAMNRRENVPSENGVEPVVFTKKGYIGLVFSDAKFGADQANMLAVFNKAKERLEAMPCNGIALNCIVFPCLLYELNTQVWGLDLWLEASQIDQEVSHKLWDGWMKGVAKEIDDAARDVWETAQS